MAMMPSLVETSDYLRTAENLRTAVAGNRDVGWDPKVRGDTPEDGAEIGVAWYHRNYSLKSEAMSVARAMLRYVKAIRLIPAVEVDRHETTVMLAADSVSALRSIDLGRVIEEAAGCSMRDGFLTWLAVVRPDLEEDARKISEEIPNEVQRALPLASRAHPASPTAADITIETIARMVPIPDIDGRRFGSVLAEINETIARAGIEFGESDFSRLYPLLDRPLLCGRQRWFSCWWVPGSNEGFYIYLALVPPDHGKEPIRIVASAKTWSVASAIQIASAVSVLLSA